MASVVPTSSTLPPAPSLEQIVEQITQVATLPNVALKVMELANNPDSGARDLKQAVESDPALSARVLKTVNSSLFALRSKITNLQQAITLLGLSQLRNLAITASVSDCFQSGNGAGPYRQVGLWRHMVAVAICARLIATRCQLLNFEDAFLAGLLHDLGIILADQQASERFRAMMTELPTNRPLCAVEQEWFGFDHTQLGAAVAAQWSFPEPVRAAIRHHHAPENYTGEGAEIVHCVAIANLLCTLKDMSSVGVKLVGLPTASLVALRIGKDDLKVFAKDLDHELELNDTLLAQVSP